ncbi:MAG: hypothetical protein IPH86_15330 [bacterium]|nr:hypothetical protein [bacterium]
MNRRHVAMFLLLAPLAAGGSRAAGESSFDPAAATNAFGIDLYRQLHAEGSNLFFSPASIAGALSMTSIGARGVTADEMDRVLHLSGDDAGVAAAFGDLMTTLTAANDHATLNVANRLYGQHDFDSRPRSSPCSTNTTGPDSSRSTSAPILTPSAAISTPGSSRRRRTRSATCWPRLAPCRHPPGAGQRHLLPGHGSSRSPSMPPPTVRSIANVAVTSRRRSCT